MKSKSIQESIVDYFNQLEILTEHDDYRYVSVDYLNKDITFGINTLPDMFSGLISKDVTGVEVKGYTFMFSAFFEYTRDVMMMIENSAFFEDLIKLIEKNNKEGILPELSGNRVSRKVEILQTPYLFSVDPNNASAQYSMTLRLIYRN